MADHRSSFFDELKRRNVYRVGIVYAVAAWLALQAIDIVVPILRAPEWFSQLVLILLVLGLPFALIFAWAFEMTPEGLKREKDVDRTESITQETGQRINRLTTSVLVLAVSFLLIDKFLLEDTGEEPAIELDSETIAENLAPPAAAETIPSIAVLPFANMSADESSAYFSDGLADTLLHMLAQIREIRVAARTSSFQFRDQNTDITEIANALNVGTILEGSVQRAGNKIRVTAQLIEAESGYHLWSGNYDRDLDDVFAIQDEIANEVVAALKVSLLGESVGRLAQRETDNIDAYTEYLLGINDQQEQSYASLPRAVAHFKKAVALDPDYALALAELGDTYLIMENTGLGDFDEVLELARTSASRALEINPELASAMAVLGAAEDRLGNDEVAEQLLLRAIDKGPNDTTAKLYYAGLLWRQLRTQESFAMVDEVLLLDPLSADALNRLTVGLALTGEYDKGIQEARRLIDISPNSPVGHYREGELEYTNGNWAKGIMKAIDALEVDPNDPELATMVGDYYIALELPIDARRWYDRASEIDINHAVARASPLILLLYGNDIAGAAELARQLLDEGIGDRQGSHELILRAIWRDARETGDLQAALDFLESYFPHLYEDAVEWVAADNYSRVVIGSMMFAAGDEARGEALLRGTLSRVDEIEAAFGPWLLGVRASNGLGDRDDALKRLKYYSEDPYTPVLWPIRFRDASDTALLREEPEFQELIADFKQNAAQQREILTELLGAK